MNAADERQMLDAISRWLERDVRQKVRELEHDDVYPEEMVERMKQLGLFGATIPQEYGGLGLPATTYAKIVATIAEVWMSLTGIFNSHLIMAAAVSRFGTDAQKRHFLPKFATGELRGGLALTEPDCGTDLQAIRTRAVRSGDSYVINGTKTWISNGIHGGCVALLVKTDPAAEPRHKGMSMFLAEKRAGFRVSRKLEKLGYKGIDSAELVFEDYRVPADCLIGGVEGKGFHHAVGGLELGRINVAARGLGVANAGSQGVGRVFPGAQELRQANLRASGDPAQARRDGDPLRGGAAAAGKRGARIRFGRALRHGSRHGEVLRVGSRAREQHRGAADPRRLRLLDRVQRRALLPRCAADVHRRRDERDAAHHHRPPADRAEPRLMLPLEGVRVLAVEGYGAGPVRQRARRRPRRRSHQDRAARGWGCFARGRSVFSR
jgi:alkylation response protein AidB-like acyl-CoA dehydrogenase